MKKLKDLLRFLQERGFRGLLFSALYRLNTKILKQDGTTACINSLKFLKSFGMKYERKLEEVKPSTCWQPGKVRFILDCLKNTETIKEDIVEMGSYKGGGTIIMAEQLRALSSSRRIFAFDSFAGFPDISENDRMINGNIYASTESFRDVSFRNVKKLLALLNLDGYTKVIKGRFQQVIPTSFADEKKFSIVILDADLHDGTKFGLEFFYSRLAREGVLILDDYCIPGEENTSTYPGVKRAVDTFLADKPEKVIHAAHSMWYFTKQN